MCAAYVHRMRGAPIGFTELCQLKRRHDRSVVCLCDLQRVTQVIPVSMCQQNGVEG